MKDDFRKEVAFLYISEALHFVVSVNRYIVPKNKMKVGK